jgi:hypothetical protein
VLGGAGMGLSFVPVTIASLTGVERSDAGVASGLVNTSRQIGGAIGLAAMSAIAASSSSSFASGHAVSAVSGLALDHGFRAAIWTMTGVLLFAAALVGLLLAPPRRQAAEEPEHVILEEAA